LEGGNLMKMSQNYHEQKKEILIVMSNFGTVEFKMPKVSWAFQSLQERQKTMKTILRITSTLAFLLITSLSCSQKTFDTDRSNRTQNGTFSHKLQLKAPGFYSLNYTREKILLFISPGDRINIGFNKSSPTFSGIGSSVNTFIQEHTRLAKSNSSFLDKNNQAVFSLEPDEFKRKIDSLESAENKLLNNFLFDNKNVPFNFKSKLDIDILYRNKRYRLLYPHNYNRYKNFKKKAAVRSDYFDNIVKGSFDDPALLESKDYIRCINYYLDILSVGEYKFRNLEHAPGERINSRYRAIIDLDANQEIKDFFLGEHFKQLIATYSVLALEYGYRKFIKDCKNEGIKQEIAELYEMGHHRRKEAHEIKVYKHIGDIELEAHIFYPDDFKTTDKRPAHLYFYGGGWAMGMPEWSYNACKKAASEGRVGITFDYRLRHVHGATIQESVSDALAAVAWVRGHSPELGVDQEKILVEGFSAGGHLAACTAMIDNPEDFGVDSEFSTKPNAVILGSTPYDIRGRDVYEINYDPASISPIDLIKNGLPPMLLFHGEEDNIVKFSEFQAFIAAMKSTNNEFIYRSFKGAGHYYNGGGESDSEVRSKMTTEFLEKHGYLMK